MIWIAMGVFIVGLFLLVWSLCKISAESDERMRNFDRGPE